MKKSDKPLSATVLPLHQQVQAFVEKWAPRSKKRREQFVVELQVLANDYAWEGIKRGCPPDSDLVSAAKLALTAEEVEYLQGVLFGLYRRFADATALSIYRKLDEAEAAMQSRENPEDGASGPQAIQGCEGGAMKFELDLSSIDRQERSISPTLDSVITLPVLVDGKHSAIAVYIAASPFDLDTTDDEKTILVQMVAAALTLGDR